MRLITQENRGESQFRLTCVSLVDDAKITSPDFIEGSFKILLSQNRERSEGSPQLCWWTTPTPKLNAFSFSDNAGFRSVVLCLLRMPNGFHEAFRQTGHSRRRTSPFLPTRPSIRLLLDL